MAARLMDQPGEAIADVHRQPAIDRVRIARQVQPMSGDMVGTLPIGDLQQSGAALPQIRAVVMVAGVLIVVIFVLMVFLIEL